MFTGWLRTIGSGLAAVGLVLSSIPEPHCIAIGAVLLKVGASLGGAGVVRAGLNGTLFNLTKKY